MKDLSLCIHSHDRQQHPNCFSKGTGHPKWYTEARMGFLDIETTGLDASFGTMLSWCIKPRDEDVISMITNAEHIRSEDEDKFLVNALINEMLKYDLLITYYGTRFDIPFARTRAFWHGLEFPSFGSIYHLDLYFVARSKLKIPSNRLEKVSEVFGYDEKTKLKPQVWRRAGQGNQKALDYVLEHNVQDVIVLEKTFKRMESLFKGNRSSI